MHRLCLSCSACSEVRIFQYMCIYGIKACECERTVVSWHMLSWVAKMFSVITCWFLITPNHRRNDPLP
jgi:hypothetical protein